MNARLSLVSACIIGAVVVGAVGLPRFRFITNPTNGLLGTNSLSSTNGYHWLGSRGPRLPRQR